MNEIFPRRAYVKIVNLQVRLSVFFVIFSLKNRRLVKLLYTLKIERLNFMIYWVLVRIIGFSHLRCLSAHCTEARSSKFQPKNLISSIAYFSRRLLTLLVLNKIINSDNNARTLGGALITLTTLAHSLI